MAKLGVTVTREQVHRDLWTLTEEMQFRKLRVDRAAYGGTDASPDCWVEIGYASEEIHIRTNYPDLRLRRRWDLIEADEVLQLLSELIDRSALEGAQ